MAFPVFDGSVYLSIWTPNSKVTFYIIHTYNNIVWNMLVAVVCICLYTVIPIKVVRCVHKEFTRLFLVIWVETS